MKTLDRITTATNDNGHAATATKKAKGFRFQVEYCPNKNIIIIHTRKMFPLSETDAMMRSPFDKTKEKREREGNQHPLIKTIRRTKGVLKVNSSRYVLHVEKAQLFDWDEILPKVRRALKNHFADGKELEEIPSHKSSSDYRMDLHLQ